MHHTFPLVLSSLLLCLPVSGHAHAAEHVSSQEILEPPKEHEEWQGSIGALWMQYPLECAVWDTNGKRTIHCHRDGDTVNLVIRPSQDPLLSVHGKIFGKIADAHAIKKGEILDVSGTYDNQTPSLPLTVGGTAEDFTFLGIYDNTPFQGKGSYKPDSLHVSLSFTKTFPLTGTLDLYRSDSTSSSSSAFVSTGTGMTLTATGMSLTTSGNAVEITALPLLSSGTIEGATQRVVEQVQESGQALMGLSRVLTLIFQTIFAVLVVLVLITFGFLLHRLKNQQMSPPKTQSTDHAPPPHR